MLYETIVIALLAVICFLLYKIYRIKYTIGERERGFVPEKLKAELENTGESRSRENEMRFRDIGSRVSELERRAEKSERVVEKLIEGLGQSA